MLGPQTNLNALERPRPGLSVLNGTLALAFTTFTLSHPDPGWRDFFPFLRAADAVALLHVSDGPQTSGQRRGAFPWPCI